MLLIFPACFPTCLSKHCPSSLLPFILKHCSSCFDFLLLKSLINLIISDLSAVFDTFYHMPGNLMLPSAPVTTSSCHFPTRSVITFPAHLCLILYIPGFCGNFVFPTSISSLSLCYHSYTLSNCFRASSSEILLFLPVFPFRLQYWPLPFQRLADSSLQLKT